MGVADLPRWLWVTAGLLLGLAHGSVRDWAGAVDPLEDYEVLLTDPRQFEHALVAESQGHRLFKDIVVYPHWTTSASSGRKSLVHLVTGAYWDGRTQVKDGAVQARWDPACYVAAVPYEPALGRSGAGPTTAVDEPRVRTVLDHLADLRATRGVQFRYAWWWWMRRPQFTSSLAGLILIGGFAPSVLSLLVYGTLLPPPREKRASLRRVRNVPGRKSAPTFSAGASGSRDDDTLPGAAIVPEIPASSAAPLKPLPRADETPVPVSHEEEKHFGARKEDFYPTELHDAGEHK